MTVLAGQHPIQEREHPRDAESPLVQSDDDVHEREVMHPHDRRQRQRHGERRHEAAAIAITPSRDDEDCREADRSEQQEEEVRCAVRCAEQAEDRER